MITVLSETPLMVGRTPAAPPQEPCPHYWLFGSLSAKLPRPRAPLRQLAHCVNSLHGCYLKTYVPVAFCV